MSDEVQTPDSSELAQHIRTVHFALVLACVLVMTILLGGSPSTVETAYNQLNNILNIKETWNTWTRRIGFEQLSWLEKNGTTSLNIMPAAVFVTPEELARRNVLNQSHEWTVSPRYVLYFFVYMRRSAGSNPREEILAWAQKTGEGVEISSGSSEAGNSPIIRSLQDFRFFWNSVDQVYVFRVTQLSPQLYLVSNGRITNTLSWTSTSRASQQSSLELRRTGLALKGQEKCDALVDTLLSRWQPRFDIMFCGNSPLENVQAVLPAKVVSQDIPINLRLWLASQFNFPNRGKTFEETFPELHQVTQPYQELSLSDVKTILSGELKRAGERVQFLGLSLPERLLSGWGMTIILVVQLYFWVHLSEIRSRVVPGDRAFKVGWIGFYPGQIAQLLSVSTAAALPAGVLLWLAFNQPVSPILVAVLVMGLVFAYAIKILLYRIAISSNSHA